MFNSTKDNLFSRLYPLTKFFFVITVVYFSIIFDYRATVLVIVPLCLFISLLAGCLKSYLKKFIVGIALFVLFIILFQILLQQTGSDVLVDFKFVRITSTALENGFNKARFIIAMVATFLLYFETTSIEELMIALQQTKVSPIVTYIVLSAVQLIPEMGKKSQIIMQAQQARGIETTGSIRRRMKAFFPSIGPLLISSITDIQEKSYTLEVRGFTADCPKTTIKALEKRTIDYLLLAIMVLLIIVVSVYRFIV